MSTTDTYMTHHRALVDELRKIGIWFNYRQRIELAWMRYNIAKVAETDQTKSIVAAIDTCVYDRIRGLEPEHKDGWYI